MHNLGIVSGWCGTFISFIISLLISASSLFATTLTTHIKFEYAPIQNHKVFSGKYFLVVDYENTFLNAGRRKLKEKGILDFDTYEGIVEKFKMITEAEAEGQEWRVEDEKKKLESLADMSFEEFVAATSNHVPNSLPFRTASFDIHSFPKDDLRIRIPAHEFFLYFDDQLGSPEFNYLVKIHLFEERIGKPMMLQSWGMEIFPHPSYSLWQTQFAADQNIPMNFDLKVSHDIEFQEEISVTPSWKCVQLLKKLPPENPLKPRRIF